MNLGESLRLAREKRSLSQQALADRFHVTRQTVSR
ncbi:MAG: helix-turn-helix domain-containing protein [Spirochaetales bacterium]|nr:helix-turn-helix domain-containing protein [Candidatus Physcosoma equi]